MTPKDGLPVSDDDRTADEMFADMLRAQDTPTVENEADRQALRALLKSPRPKSKPLPPPLPIDADPSPRRPT